MWLSAPVASSIKWQNEGAVRLGWWGVDICKALRTELGTR